MTPISRRGFPKMRDLTENEDKILNSGKCPFCGYKEFYEGPEGGGSVNITCANDSCQAKYCFHRGIFTAQLITAPSCLSPAEAPKLTEHDNTLLDFLEPKPKSLLDKLRGFVGI